LLLREISFNTPIALHRALNQREIAPFFCVAACSMTIFR
jgi:hypothetical protein